MSNKATATLSGNLLTVRTGVNKAIAIGARVRDAKTGSTVNFVGKANDRTAMKHPFVFLDLDTNELRRHSADYIAKYIG